MEHKQEPEKLKGKIGLRQLVFVCFAIMFLVGTFLYVGTAISHRQAEKSVEAVRLVTFRAAEAGSPDESGMQGSNTIEEEAGQTTGSIDFAALRKINPEICAWLSAEGTKIDYPVLHTDDNDYYMNHLVDGQYNEYGSLFVDFRNNSDFSDKNTLIFGHRILQDGSMFGTLLQYMSQTYYDNHPAMMLYTPEGNYRVDIISGTEEGIDGEFVRLAFSSDEDFLDYVSAFRERSFFISDVELSPEDRIVSLCTCGYDQYGVRFLVIGKLTPL